MSAWRWVIKRKGLAIGLSVLLLMGIAALMAPVLFGYQAYGTNYEITLQPPSWHHLMGTDELGRDIFSRLMFGTRISFVISLAAVGLATVIGIPLGMFAGYIGGALDAAVGRLLDGLFAFPAVLMALAVGAVLGPSERTAMLAIGIVSVPEFARVARSAVLAVKEHTYVEASRALGSSTLFIVFRAILPNTLGPLLVLVSLGFGYAVLNEAALSFLGIGAQPPTPSYGYLLSRAKSYLAEAPWYSLFPGLAIFVMVLAANLVGDGLRDLGDPRQRRH
jgi:peptide/nickel transport system permease protein